MRPPFSDGTYDIGNLHRHQQGNCVHVPKKKTLNRNVRDHQLFELE